MKKLLLAILFFAGSTYTFAQTEKQNDHQEEIQDRMEQQPDPPAQRELERRAKIDAQQIEADKEKQKVEEMKAAAEKKAQDEERERKAKGNKKQPAAAPKR